MVVSSPSIMRVTSDFLWSSLHSFISLADVKASPPLAVLVIASGVINIALIIRTHAHKAKEQNVLKVNMRMTSGTIIPTTVKRLL